MKSLKVGDNIAFTALCFALVMLFSVKPLIPHVEQLAFEAKVNSSCNIPAASGIDERVVTDDYRDNPISFRYTQVWYDGKNKENRKLRLNCINLLTDNYVVPYQVLYFEQQWSGKRSDTAVKFVLFTSALISVVILIIKIFLIKANQISVGIFRLSCIGVVGITFFWLQKEFRNSSRPFANLGDITQASIEIVGTLIVVTFSYLLFVWVKQGFKVPK